MTFVFPGRQIGQDPRDLARTTWSEDKRKEDSVEFRYLTENLRSFWFNFFLVF